MNQRGRRARRFYRFQREALPYHAAAYVSLNGGLIGVWAATGEGSFWPAGVLAPTTVAMNRHRSTRPFTPPLLTAKSVLVPAQ